MTDIERTITLATSPANVWAALTDPRIIGQWMEDEAVSVELRVGGRYTFFGGATTGAFTRIAPQAALEYTWRQAEWQPAWPDSRVRWELSPAGTQTLVKLTHSHFPNMLERDSHAEGWDLYWLGPMSRWLEAHV